MLPPATRQADDLESAGQLTIVSKRGRPEAALEQANLGDVQTGALGGPCLRQTRSAPQREEVSAKRAAISVIGPPPPRAGREAREGLVFGTTRLYSLLSSMVFARSPRTTWTSASGTIASSSSAVKSRP